MDSTADKIASHIQRTREDLSSNINELENKVKSVTDWKQQFQANPMLLMGIAFGGGMILAGLFSGAQTRRNGAEQAEAHTYRDSSDAVGNSPVWKTWETTKMALVGLAANRLKEVVDEIIPGFKDHFEAVQGK